MASLRRLTRRAWLGTALAAAASAVAGAPAFARQMQTHMPPGTAPKPKGPVVFLDYDQEELDAAYTQAAWAPNQAELVARNAQKSAATIARLGPARRLAYGPTDVEKLDLFTARQPDAPINVYIHGGAWRAGRASDETYQAEMFVDAGAHFIALDFNNALETKGDLATMANQVRRGVAWVYGNARSFGGDPDRLFISGHSSGGHLAAVVLTTDWTGEFGLPGNIIKGGLCASGMYDLQPVGLSVRSNYVTFTPATIDALSPMRQLKRLTAPVIVAHGTRETPEFQRQNREFAAAVKTAGKPVEFIVLDGYNHFEVHESLGNPYAPLGRAVLRQMKLKS
jgi:arylformamidase